MTRERSVAGIGVVAAAAALAVAWSSELSGLVPCALCLLERWPYYADAPRVQDKIVRAYEKNRNLVTAAKERELLGRLYSKGGDWYQHNKENPEALAAVRGEPISATSRITRFSSMTG